MNKLEPGVFCWNELATPDVKKAKEFYAKVFGWTYEDHDMGGITYTMIKNKDNEMGGFWEIPQDKQKEIPPHWMSYILVDSLEPMLEKAKATGATVKVPPKDAGKYGRLAIIVDPTGAHVALWQTFKK